MRAIDLTGTRFARLVAKHFAGKNQWGNRRYVCECDCGNTLVVASGDLRSGHTQSCGCLQIERATAASLTHGESNKRIKTSEYEIWCSMIKRCENTNHIHFQNYGGRGIKVCNRWRTGYEHFLADMGRRPSPDHTLDRINNDGDYEPSNCRWATWVEQAQNKRKPIPGKPGKRGPMSSEHRTKLSKALSRHFADPAQRARTSRSLKQYWSERRKLRDGDPQ